MSAQELNNETFPGIEAVNGFYTAYYMQEYFPAAVGNASHNGRICRPRNAPNHRLRRSARHTPTSSTAKTICSPPAPCMTIAMDC